MDLLTVNNVGMEFRRFYVQLDSGGTQLHSVQEKFNEFVQQNYRMYSYIKKLNMKKCQLRDNLESLKVPAIYENQEGKRSINRFGLGSFQQKINQLSREKRKNERNKFHTHPGDWDFRVRGH